MQKRKYASSLGSASNASSSPKSSPETSPQHSRWSEVLPILALHLPTSHQTIPKQRNCNLLSNGCNRLLLFGHLKNITNACYIKWQITRQCISNGKNLFSSYLQFVTSPHNIISFQLLLFMFTISILFSPSFSGVVFPSWWSANPQIKCSNISADDRFQFQDYKIYSLVDSCQLRVSHLPSERVLFQLESSISSIRMWIVQV